MDLNTTNTLGLQAPELFGVPPKETLQKCNSQMLVSNENEIASSTLQS